MASNPAPDPANPPADAQNTSPTDTTSSSTSTSSTSPPPPPPSSGRAYNPPLSTWKKENEPPIQCLWTDHLGRPAAWRQMKVDPVKPQVRGLVRQKGDRNPANWAFWIDEGLEDDPRWKGRPGLKEVMEEREGWEKVKEERRREDREREERRRREDRERGAKEEGKLGKTPWWLKVLGGGSR